MAKTNITLSSVLIVGAMVVAAPRYVGLFANSEGWRIVGGVLLAILFIVFGLPWLLTGVFAMTLLRFIPFFAAMVWSACRLRGSEMRKHGGVQLWLPTLALCAAVGLLLMTGCSDIGRRVERTVKAETRPAQQQPAQSQPSGGKSAQDAEWERVLQSPGPTPEHLPAQCPGATNAEIDAALQSNEPWVCYAATREAANE